MTSIRYGWFVLGLVFLVVFPLMPVAQAQGRVAVEAFIQPPAGIVEDQPFQLVIQVTGSQNARASTLPEFPNLRVIGGPNTSVRSSWDSRQNTVTMTAQLIYRLLPEGPGPATIPALEIKVGSEFYRTKAIKFDVAKARKGPQLQNAPQRRSSAAQVDVFLQADLGSKSVWVGQTVPLTYSIYALSGTVIRDNAVIDSPTFSGFWVEDLKANANAERFQTNRDGRRYDVYPFQRSILVPQTPGELEIEPYVMEFVVRQRNRLDPYDLFSRGRTIRIERKSEPLKLEARSLPREKRPEGFSGAVGQFEMKAALDRTETPVNEAVALKVTVEGTGLLRAIKPPEINVPPDVKLFDPKVTSSFKPKRGQMVSKRTWEWILVPLVQNDVQLQDIEFSFFDPATENYETARVTPPLVSVKAAAPGDVPRSARGDIQLQRKDLQYIKPLRGTLQMQSPRAHARTSFLVLLALPVLWVPLVILAGRQRARLQRNRGFARSKRARAKARKRLRQSRRTMDQSDSAEFHEDIARTLVDYVADRFDRSGAGLTYELADELLGSKSIDDNLRQRYRACLETCDFARFVPDRGQPERRAEIHEEASKIVEELERAW